MSVPSSPVTADRMARGRALYLAVYENQGGKWEANESKEIWCDKADRYLELAGTAHAQEPELKPHRITIEGNCIVDGHDRRTIAKFELYNGSREELEAMADRASRPAQCVPTEQIPVGYIVRNKETGAIASQHIVLNRPDAEAWANTFKPEWELQPVYLAANGYTLTSTVPTLTEMEAALTAYRAAQRWATGTEEHRLAIQAADKINPMDSQP